MTYSGRSSAQLATRVVFNSGVLTTSYDIEAISYDHGYRCSTRTTNARTRARSPALFSS